jgi:LmbE family N-acetylglucosaminyl deacetylase
MQTRLGFEQLGTVLGVWAHPDDEAFLSAGLMGRVIDRGGHVACATATRGEAGTPDPVAWPPERLGQRRTTELRASLAAIGVTEHRFLDLEDGTLAEVPAADGVARITAVLDAVRPDTVVTFGPEGMTGHPDHIAVSCWATIAAQRSDRAIRVLYATTTIDFARRWGSVNRDLEVFGDGLPLATAAEEIAVEVALEGAELDRKLVALAAQSSQMGPVLRRLGEDVLRDWWSTETFALAPPASAWPGPENHAGERSPARVVT